MIGDTHSTHLSQKNGKIENSKIMGVLFQIFINKTNDIFEVWCEIFMIRELFQRMLLLQRMKYFRF